MSSPYLENPFFHHKQKGCQVIRKKQPGMQEGVFLEGLYCITHHIDLCGACGHEWHHGLEIEPPTKYPRLPKNETNPIA
jgi:hypothetical protein